MSATEVFLDTNVLLHLLSSDAAKADRAEALLAAGGVISVQVLNEFASVATRTFGLAIPEVREILTTICAICTVKPLDVETHEAALDLAERHRFVDLRRSHTCRRIAGWVFSAVHGGHAARPRHRPADDSLCVNARG
jgi:predicted nucleic acid-binding protein